MIEEAQEMANWSHNKIYKEINNIRIKLNKLTKQEKKINEQIEIYSIILEELYSKLEESSNEFNNNYKLLLTKKGK
ncbi:MAG: hypothetical protein IKF19_03615 [Bacilli bacterium]|nr:hypothetical protein [Bacilli bacterium]